MSTAGIHRRRGMPLAVLAFILGAWVVLRAAIWNASLEMPALAVAGPAELFQAGGEGAEALAASDTSLSSAPAPQSIAYAPMLAYPPYRLAYDGRLPRRDGTQRAA